MRPISGLLPALAILLSCAIPPAEAQTRTLTPGMLQAAGALIEPVGNHALLAILRLDGTEAANWYLLGPDSHTRQLGSGLSQLPQVQQIAASPNHAWLAVLSSGEGHPLVEIIDLRQLLETRRYVVLQQINPYPGSIHLNGWQGLRLILSSNAPLARHATDRPATSPGQLLSTPHNFSVTISTGRIEEVTAARPSARPGQRTR